jgi:sulfoxide reductase catalytic subunit YedY
MEDLLKMFPQDRIYRLLRGGLEHGDPVAGLSLASLLKVVGPRWTRNVAFTSLQDPEQFPGQGNVFYPWPYTEGLRLDEAMNDLTLMVTGLYGAPLPPQDGAPLRVMSPWKYGFKGIKAIVKMELVAGRPFRVDRFQRVRLLRQCQSGSSHPRWLQSSERRIGELNRRPTLMFNGYAEQVAHLYEGMDLAQNY